MEEQEITYEFIDVVGGEKTGNKIELCVKPCGDSTENAQKELPDLLRDLFSLYRGMTDDGKRFSYRKWKDETPQIGYKSGHPEEVCSDSRIYKGDGYNAKCLVKSGEDFVNPTSATNGILLSDDQPSYKYLVGDYRRIVADVFYTLYRQQTGIAQIDTIRFIKSDENDNEKSETWIIDQGQSNVVFDDDRIAFWGYEKDNNELKKLCLPIGLKDNTSALNENLRDNGSRFYYLINDGKIDLTFYKNYDVRNGWKIDLFYGKDKEGYTGIYYYYLNNELKHKLQITDEGIFVNDIRNPENMYKLNFGEINGSNDYANSSKKLEEKTECEELEKIAGKIISNLKYAEKYGYNNNSIILKRIKDDDGNAFRFKYPVDQEAGEPLLDLEINMEEDNSSANTDYDLKITDIWCKCDNGISIYLKGTKKEEWRYRIDDYIWDFGKFEILLDKKHKIAKALDGISFDTEEKDPWKAVLKAFDTNKGAFEEFALVCREKFDELLLKDLKILKKLASPDGEIAVWNIEDKLFEGLTADHTVARKICDEVKKWEATGKKKIPNLAIMGEPGTGKTTLVKRIAACFKKEEEKVLVLSPSDLKGAYVGQTIPRVFDHLKDASEHGLILFLDEAYLLYEDQFGREALAYLLPIMTGDRKEITKKNIETQEEESYNLEENGIPPIWMAGYEPEMRKVLSKNPGLYRRMVTLTLPTPTCSNLFDSLTSQAEKETANLGKHLKASEADIKAYFTWAGARETAGYFGNYAGVEKFLRTCKARELDKAKTDEDARKIINQIIDEYKKEYKAQYKAVLTDLKKPKFTVYRDVDTRLDDVKGNKPLREQLKQIVNMLIYQEDYNQCGIQVPKGALLVGPPGTGKTFVARAVAGEFQANLVGDKQIAFISVIATELGSPEMIEALFDEAAEYDASIIFIDEIDAIGGNRFLNKQDQPLLIQLMKELDGFDARKNIFVMAATNAPESLDEALKRPGRFDQIIEISYPDEEGRKAIIEGYLGKLEWFKEEKTEKTENKEKTAGTIAKITKGFTPAELKNLINLAAIERYTRENKSDNDSNQANKPEDFVNVVTEKIETLRIGERKQKEKPEKFSVGENQGCSATAIHEVGHAVMSLLQKMEPFEKITILPRGNALGYVTPSTNNRLYTKKDFLNNIRVYMGGRVAEELFYGEDISTGAAQDIQMATELAESMVAKFGMSDVIGMMAVKKDKGNYLGESSEYTCSDAFRYDVENEVRNLLAKQMEIVRIELGRMKDIIQELAKEVFEKETMTGDEFKKLYDEKKKEKENGKTMHDPVEDKQE